MSMSISAFRFGAITAPKTDDSKAKETQARAEATETAFLTEAKKSPAERMRERILKEMNLTEEDLAKMDAKEREVVEDSIAKKMREMAEAAREEKKPGLLADVTV